MTRGSLHFLETAGSNPGSQANIACIKHELANINHYDHISNPFEQPTKESNENTKSHNLILPIKLINLNCNL